MKTNFETQQSSLKIGIGFIILFIIFIGITSYNQRRIFIKSHKLNLQILAIAKSNQINTFLDSQKEKLVAIASLNDFKEAVLSPNNPQKIETAKKTIYELKNVIPGISLLNSDGIVIVGDIDFPGTDYTQHPYFSEKRQDIRFTKYSDPIRNKEYYAVIGPIYDGNNTIIGRIAFDIELDQINVIFKQSLEENTNIELIDNEGLILGGSIFLDHQNDTEVLVQKDRDLGARICLSHLKEYGQTYGIVEYHEDEIVEYVNHSGLNVFGTHAYVPNIYGCIIAEQRADHVLQFSVADSLKNIFNPFVSIK